MPGVTRLSCASSAIRAPSSSCRRTEKKTSSRISGCARQEPRLDQEVEREVEQLPEQAVDAAQHHVGDRALRVAQLGHALHVGRGGAHRLRPALGRGREPAVRARVPGGGRERQVLQLVQDQVLPLGPGSGMPARPACPEPAPPRGVGRRGRSRRRAGGTAGGAPSRARSWPCCRRSRRRAPPRAAPAGGRADRPPVSCSTSAVRTSAAAAGTSSLASITASESSSPRALSHTSGACRRSPAAASARSSASTASRTSDEVLQARDA